MSNPASDTDKEAALAAAALAWAEIIEDVARLVKTILGDTYLEIESRHRRGLKNPKTPQGRQHRLMRILDEVYEMTTSLKNTNKEHTTAWNKASLIELCTTLQLLTHTSESPSTWHKIAKSLKGPENYDHTIATLYLQNVIRSWGYQAELLHESETDRVADLAMYRAGSHVANIEVKTSTKLTDRTTPLKRQEAEDIVNEKFKSVGNPNCGQLSSVHTAIVAIAGIGLSPSDLSKLENATTEWFNRREHRRKNIAGVWLSSVDVYGINPDGSQRLMISTEIRPALTLRFVNNTSYHGKINIVENRREWTISYGENYTRWGPYVELTTEEFLGKSERR